MNSMEMTSLVAGIFALLIVPLSVQISLRRAKANVVFGDAGDETLRKRIRAHGNFIEYAPMAVLVLGMIEYRGGPRWLVWSLAAGFVFSRIVHAVGMLFTSTPPVRAVAMLVNHASFLTAGVWLVSSI
jgi:uncharacterized membrane protein YecN with MAPEG domain